MGYHTQCKKQLLPSTLKKAKKKVQATIDYYMENARIMRESLSEIGYTVFGRGECPLCLGQNKKQCHFMGIF